MLRLLGHKGVAKIFSIILALFFIIGIGSLAYTQVVSPSMSATPDSSIGYVDRDKVLDKNSTIYLNAAKEFNDYQNQVQADVQKQMAATTDPAQQQIQEDASEKLKAKNEELLKKLNDQVTAAAKDIGDAKGLSIVVDKNDVLYGGMDITDQVAHRLNDDTSDKK